MTEEYTDDVAEIDFVNTYVSGDAEERESFASDLWGHAEKPQTLPEDVSWDDLDDKDVEDVRVVDDGAAEKQARSWYKFASATYPQPNRVVFKIPAWFASDELGAWDEWWFGQLETAKREDGEWTAFCVSDAEPMSDRTEDEYFRSPVDEEWIPVSLTEFAFAVEEPDTEAIIFGDGDPREGTLDDADISVVGVVNTRYGGKANLDSPYEAKDDIKDLSWDAYHPNWSGDHWQVDSESLKGAVNNLTDAGWTVSVPSEIVRNGRNGFVGSQV
jgi:hypothetical protein